VDEFQYEIDSYTAYCLSLTYFYLGDMYRDRLEDLAMVFSMDAVSGQIGMMWEENLESQTQKRRKRAK